MPNPQAKVSVDSPPRVEFYRHAISEEDIAAASEVLRSVFLTTGPVNARVEAKLAEYLGRSAVVAVNSCTSALVLSLKALGIGEGDEVITTPMTFAASVSAILHAGATPVLVDVEPETALMDVGAVESRFTSRTRAVLPVHLYGQMVDMRQLADVCRPRGIRIVEDCAHALEAERDGVRPGDLSDLACFSFYATKNLTCGEGGAVATDDAGLADKIRKLRNHGMSKSGSDRHAQRYEHWDIVELGYKANMPDILAALLVNQIDRLDTLLARRQEIAGTYEEAFDNLANVDYPRVLPGNRSARHMFTIWVPESERDNALVQMGQHGVGVAVNYRAVHLLTYFRQRLGHSEGSFPHAERIGHRTMTLPLYPDLAREDQQRVIEVVGKLADQWN